MVALGFDCRRAVGIGTILSVTLIANAIRAEDAAPAGKPSPISVGRELFEREWLPKDPRSPGGDGLGPLFNETSCVACHNQGGVGGAGSAARNVHLVVADVSGIPNPADGDGFKKKLAEIHPMLRPGKSLTIHRFSTSPTYPQWRSRMDGLDSSINLPFAGFGPGVPLPPGIPVPPGIPIPPGFPLPKNPAPKDAVATKLRDSLKSDVTGSETKRSDVLLDGGIHVSLAQRNTPSLFGSGLLDSIPDNVIIAAEKSRDPKWSTVKGVAPRNAEGKVGRFGWKGERTRLRDFVAQACAQELGLHLDGEPQPIDPENVHYKAPGPDMTAQQVDHLTAFVASLPRPREREAVAEFEGKKVAAGRDRFMTVGCAACHQPRLGDVSNVYTDLLLHDMGQELWDQGEYGQFFGDQGAADPAKKTKGKSKEVVATIAQWRTPPLWGLRDSAPYLHDGRAETIEQAIALHGGEAEPSAKAYFELTAEQRGEIQTFLKTLVAP